MKLIIAFIFLCYSITFSQTYKVDLGGVSNQYPTQIGLLNGDIVISTIENYRKINSEDAVNLFNVNKNKFINFSSNSRETNPRMIVYKNDIFLTYWNTINSGEDLSQLVYFDSSLNVKDTKQLNFNQDTEIYSTLNFNNSYYLSGAIKEKGFISKLNSQSGLLNSFSIFKSNSQYFAITNILEKDNNLIVSYFDTGLMGLAKIDTNLNLIINKDYNFNNEVKLTKGITNTYNNYYVLSDNYNFSYTQILNTSIHIFDTLLSYVKENQININNSPVFIRNIKAHNDLIYIIGYYKVNSKYKSIISELDTNLSIKYSLNVEDLDVISDIYFDSNQNIYLVGTTNNIGDNGDIVYLKTNGIRNICNTNDITLQTNITTKNDITSLNTDNLNTNTLVNRSANNSSYTYLTSSTSEICKLSTTTSIQGIINKYIDVLEIDTCNNKIKVAPTNEYFVNDYVLMIQMQGATIDTSNTPKYGDLIDLKSCGLYEFGFIYKVEKAVDGSWITFKNKIVNTYNINGSVQLVNVPIYENAEVIGDIIGKPWDGKSGGVIVVKANDTLNLKSGNIDASGIGFRGGRNSDISSANNITDYVTNNPQLAGEKGESIYKITNGYRYGRGKSANGGGGGNAHNGGGGGGANLSCNNYEKLGGLGGNAYGNNWLAFGGIGGQLYSLNVLNNYRLIMGGGGGGGHTDENVGGNGSNGGGIIILNSKKIFNSNKSLISRGLNSNNSLVDATGGGGGGGCGVIFCEIFFNSNLIVDLSGGNSGDAQGGSHLAGCTGGGGTIGYFFSIWLNGIDNISNIGKSGVTNNNNLTGFYPGEDAKDKEILLYNSKPIKLLTEQTKPFETLEAVGSYQKSFSLCDSSKVTITAPLTNPKYTYKWDTGETGTKIQVTKAGKFKCLISFGCTNYLAEFEVTDNQIQYNLTIINFENKCGFDSVQVSLNFNSSNASVVWFDGSNSKIRTFTKNGKYKYTLKLTGFCDLTSEVDIQGIGSGISTSLVSIQPDTLLFSNSDIDKLICQTFTLTNVGTDTLTIKELAYLKKLNFSSPNSIFPITLMPNGSKDLEVCFFGNKFRTNYSDSIRFDNCNNPIFLTLLADIPEDTLSFTTRCMLKFNAAAPSKSIAMNKSQLYEFSLQFPNNYKLSNLLGLKLLDFNAILPNQLIYFESSSLHLRILVIE